MPTLMIPSFERRLLQTVSEAVTAEPVGAWPEQSLQLCLDLLRKIRENNAALRRTLEGMLSGGVEARSLARDYNPLLADIADQIVNLREIAERVAPAEDAASARFKAELHPLVVEMEAYRDLLADAVARASVPLPPFDESRLPPAPTGPRAEGYISVKEAIDRVRAGNKP